MPSVKPTSSFFSFRRCPDDYQQALRIVLEAGLHMDAINPHVDVVFG
jgi:hypothetical protein